MNQLCDKMEVRGVQALSDGELLTLLVGDAAVAEAIVAEYGSSLSRLAAEPLPRLRMLGGMGLKRARHLQAAMELGRRIAAARARDVEVVNSGEDVVRLFRPHMETLQHEECWALYLSSSNRILKRQMVSCGGVQSTVVDFRIIVRNALDVLATQMILVHNHPSGAAEPSPQDRKLTQRVAEAAALFEIRLLDHVILSREGEFSFAREGLLK